MPILTSPALAEREASTLECDDHACLNATSHVSLCDCSTCFGLGHGAEFRAARARGVAGFEARVRRNGGDVFAPFHTGRDDDAADAAFGIGPISRSNRTIDPEDRF